MTAHQEWHYSKGNEKFGPVSAIDLKRLAASGDLSPDDLVWKEGMTDWKRADSIKGLFKSDLPNAPPPLPPPPLAPQSPAAQPTTGNNKATLVIGTAVGGLTLVMFVCCGLAGLIGGSQSTTAIENSKPEDVMLVSAYRLFFDYEANDIAADKKYKGKVIQVTGSVDKISRDILNTIYVTLRTGEYEIFSIQCFFADSFEDQAAALRPNQPLTIRGRCDGKFGNVMLKECVIVR